MSDEMAKMSLTHQIVLLLDDDAVVTEGLSAALARPGRTIVTCNDLESAELVVEWLRPSHVVSDVRLSGPFAYEGLDFIRFVKRHAPDSRIILMTGDAPDALQMEASERGAVGFLQKPFETGALDSTLDLLAPARPGSPEWPEIIAVPTLDDIIASDALGSAWQPVVSLGDRRFLGFEALARFRSESLLRNPELLFTYAARKNRVADLEMACLRSSLNGGRELAANHSLFLNIHPSVFDDGPRLEAAVRAGADAAGIALDRLVLEITEQGSLGERRKVLDAVARLGQAGVRFAFDDVGVAYSHLTFIDAVRPSFLKISQHFGTNFERDATKAKLVKNLLSLARDFDSELILEGIESEATASAAAELGIPYGQGYHFARPAPAEDLLAAYRSA
jgi:EAL domain-containing protein (putative c-di-GMP-specific phosphodiesterase class I)